MESDNLKECKKESKRITCIDYAGKTAFVWKQGTI